METQVLIVGGGLSGLHTAYKLSKQNIDFVLLEARERLGGRILSHNAGQSAYRMSEPGLDLGPSWFWPGQRRMAELVDELNLSDAVVSQYGAGDGLFEDGQSIRRGVAGVSMAGAYRLRGGMRQLTATLETALDPHCVRLHARVTHVASEGGEIQASVDIAGTRTEMRSKQIVFAMPPRLVVEAIDFAPILSAGRRSELQAMPTWMAGQAKFVATYAEPFWRNRGLSGDAVSHRGPLAEIHDASADVGEPFALFGFLGVPAAQRKGNVAALKQAAIEQLDRLFGEPAMEPLDVVLKDWAMDRYTASQWDLDIPDSHSMARLAETSESAWGHRLLWSGSENASGVERNGGFLEGALEASERTVTSIEASLARVSAS